MKIQRSLFCLVLLLVMAVAGYSQTAPTITIGPDLGIQRLGPIQWWLEATGGQAPYKFSFTPSFPQSPGFAVHNRDASVPDTLPGWFPSTVTGGLLGVAATPGTYNFRVRVTGNDGLSSDKDLTFQVPAVVIANGGLRDTSVGEDYSYQLEGGGGTPPYTFALAPFPRHCLLGSASVPPAWFPELQPPLILNVPGLYQFRLRVTDATGNVGVRTMTLRVSPVIVQNFFGNENATTQASYSRQLLAFGGAGPYTWALSSGALPPGLTLSSGGLLSGTPTTPGSYNFSVLATDSGGNTAVSFFSVVVSSLNITNNPVLPNATFNQPYSVTFNATGTGPYVWTANFVPSGLALDSSTGVLSGTPSFTGTSIFDVTVGNTAGTQFFTKRFAFNSSLLPQSALVSVSNSFSSDFTVGQFLATQLFASGGLPPYAWSVQSGALPPGLSFLAGSSFSAFVTPGSTFLSGVPTTPGTYTFKLRATDSVGTFGSRSITLKVSPLAFASASLRRARLGESFAVWGARLLTPSASSQSASSPELCHAELRAGLVPLM